LRSHLQIDFDRSIAQGLMKSKRLTSTVKALVPSGMWLELRGAISGNMRLSDQAARSIG
jgi:hypothetical protein